MSSSAKSSREIYVTDKMLKEFSYLFAKHTTDKACSLLLSEYIGDIDLSTLNLIYMKEQAIVYYIEGPAWMHDDHLLHRSWLKGFQAACGLAGQPFNLSFTIEQYCVSKLQTPLQEIEE